jgi:hypothetical protein
VVNANEVSNSVRIEPSRLRGSIQADNNVGAEACPENQRKSSRIPLRGYAAGLAQVLDRSSAKATSGGMDSNFRMGFGSIRVRWPGCRPGPSHFRTFRANRGPFLFRIVSGIRRRLFGCVRQPRLNRRDM